MAWVGAAPHREAGARQAVVPVFSTLAFSEGENGPRRGAVESGWQSRVAYPGLAPTMRVLACVLTSFVCDNA